MKDDEQLVAVVYHRRGDSWYPHSIQTRMSAPESSWGWVAHHYDASYSRAHDTVFVHLSGFGGDGNDVYVSEYVEPETMPARIWLHADARLSAWRDERVVIAREDVAAMGYAIIDELLGDPFADTVDDDVTYCEACDDYFPDDDTFDCAVCCERSHRHGVGSYFVVVDSETNVSTGLYKVTHCPFYMSSMLGGGWIDEHAVERVGPVPDRTDTNGYPCAWVCDACRDALTKEHASP